MAVTGAASGLLFARWSGALLVQQLSTWQKAVSLDLGLDWRVLAFTAPVRVCRPSSPLWRRWRIAACHPWRVLKDAGRGSRRPPPLRARRPVVVQIAVSFVLVVGAGLFLRTFATLNQLPLGFVPAPLLVAELNLQAGGGPPEERAARVERLREVSAAVQVSARPPSRDAMLAGGGWQTANAAMATDRSAPGNRRPSLWLNATTPGWFETWACRSRGAGTSPPRSRRQPSRRDRESSVRSPISSRQPPVGRMVRAWDSDRQPSWEIVGIVGDTVYSIPATA